LNKFEHHITITTEDCNAIAVLSEHCNLSIGELKQAITRGALWLTRGKSTQRLRRVKKTLKINDELHFYYDQQVLTQKPPSAILMADLTDYSVWFKPYGMLSQGSKWSDHCTISRWAQNHLVPERSTFIVHRLDRAATGLILVAHSKKAARALSEMFEKHQLEKHYHIIVHGDFSQRIEAEVVETPIDNKSARSTFTHLKFQESSKTSLVQVKIDSGRKHQIRKHAASINMPVLGDRLHGDKTRNYPETQHLQLCAVSLKFTCPLTEQVRFFEVPEQLRPQLEA
jgi:tRNA pseudouridine32 synthase/23S rRNA pseudouridine746 synthase